MKKLLFIFTLFIFFVPQSFAKPNDTMYVSIKNATLKEKNKKFSKTLHTINYADKIKVEKEQNSWAYVYLESDSSIKGWIPLSSLSKRKILKSNNISANAKELALAGKGFSSAIEAEYFKSKDNNIEIVNEIETFSSSEQEIIEFINLGKLNNE